MTFQQIDSETEATLRKRLADMKEEQQDISIQIKEIDFHVNQLLDLQVKLRKKSLKENRHSLSEKSYQNSMSIAELERVLYNKGYNIKDEGEAK